MTLSVQRLQEIVSLTGFRMDTVERVVHLMNLLESIEQHSVLRGKFALKGSTAQGAFRSWITTNLQLENWRRYSPEHRLETYSTLIGS